MIEFFLLFLAFLIAVSLSGHILVLIAIGLIKAVDYIKSLLGVNP